MVGENPDHVCWVPGSNIGSVSCSYIVFTVSNFRYFVFPYLLSDRIPQEALVVWPPENPDGLIQYGMELDVFHSQLPIGLFEKILVRCNEFLDYSISWRQGVVAFCSGGMDLVRIHVRTNPKTANSAASDLTNENSLTDHVASDFTNPKPGNSASGPNRLKTLESTNEKSPINHMINDSTNPKPSSDHVIIELSTRVQKGREEKSRHILMLLLAVINRIILHHYPGTVALWYVQCPNCIKNRSNKQVWCICYYFWALASW